MFFGFGGAGLSASRLASAYVAPWHACQRICLEAPVPAADPDPDTDSADARGRAAAASFFAAHSGGEAAVPLPPSTSFMEDSEDEEEEGPPGLGSVELPPEIFKKVKNTGNRNMKEH